MLSMAWYLNEYLRAQRERVGVDPARACLTIRVDIVYKNNNQN